ALPDTRIDGLSGSLSLNPAQRIERQLPWAEFRGGRVEHLPDSLN
ncbi:MAG TPA: penicillin-binding protein activator, partial [Pseudomonas sp.]|nr:penicillin-binding protein activator [Pseudomonas sp.]